jgi:hypothetical protein
VKPALRSLAQCAVAGAFAVLLSNAAIAQQQQKCFPSKFGPKDEIGNANHLT